MRLSLSIEPPTPPAEVNSAESWRSLPTRPPRLRRDRAIVVVVLVLEAIGRGADLLDALIEALIGVGSVLVVLLDTLVQAVSADLGCAPSTQRARPRSKRESVR